MRFMTLARLSFALAVAAFRNDVNRAPAWRLNAGVGHDAGRFFWNASVNYQGKSYWADVLFARATTAAFVQVNASLGRRFGNDDFRLELIAQNLFDHRLQQHSFGDIIERRITARMVFAF